MPVASPPGNTHDSCPVLCITKICLFVVTTLFVLYLPLGDPQILCDAKNAPTGKKNLIRLCDVYSFMMRMADYTIDTLDMLVCATMSGLYEAKLVLYSALSTYDRQDFCRVGCCTDDDDECSFDRKRPCTCKNCKCRRRK